MFPVRPNLNKISISISKRQDHIKVKYTRICGYHFRASDYTDAMRNRLLGLHQKKILKPDAVPSANLQLQDNGEDVSNRSERKIKKKYFTGSKNQIISRKKACGTPAMEPFTTSTTENNCSSCFETQKENTLLL
ncbi:hypothetical protein AVEN_107294-1 [Araneus ventricosus]|uniref:THAP-type domain-containing protein n=1 Tax=Araneus ventricosus TaxID=182803 RepID=A0A4Y2DUX0_ARAVE|nr:hypothetical protein AVEN_107294-1 [Araneus ventricosus]